MSLYALGPKHPQGEVLSALEDAFVMEWTEVERGRLTYLDTFDWRVFNAGCNLSLVRPGSRRILTLRRKGGEELHQPLRKTPAFARDIPPGVLRDIVAPLSGIRRLLPRAQVEWEARSAGVLNEDQKTVARIRVRSGEAVLPGTRKKISMPPTLEVLPLKGYGPSARAVRSFLWRTFGLRASRKTEMALVAEALGEAPGQDPSDPQVRLQPHRPAAEAVREVFEALLSVLVVNEEGLRKDLDPEFLHDFRVAIRKTRAALGQIKGVYPPSRVQHFSQEFRWLGSRTGPPRDMDVYLLKIPDYQQSFPGGVKDELQPLVDFLEHKKRIAHRSLVRTLRTTRYARLLQEWEAFLQSPLPEVDGVPNARRPILDVAQERIWRVYKRVMKDGGEAGRMGEDAPAEALHDLRIRCKRLRYLVGFFQSLFPPEELSFLTRELKRLQDTLGDFNDLHVQQLALRRFADEMLRTRGGPPETLMAMGRLMGQLETRQESERKAFHKTFNRFARPKNVKRFKGLLNPQKRA